MVEIDAFCSVYHKFIQFALHHHHCDDVFVGFGDHLCGGLWAMVSTHQWCTRDFLCRRRCISRRSVVGSNFDMVIDLFVDALGPLESCCA